MSGLPHVIRAAYVITWAASIIRPVADLDRYRSRITCIGAGTVIRSTTIIGSSSIIGSITWISAVIPFAAHCTERDGYQNQPE
jgi:hypothetical protein